MNNNLVQLRNKNALAVWGLAARSGVSPSTIPGIEKWDYNPRDETKRRLASALNVDVAEIWPPFDSGGAN